MWQRYNQTTHIFEKSIDNGANWAPLPLDASIINEGSISSALLPANVAYKDIDNIFTTPQTIPPNSGIVGNSPHFNFYDPAAAVGKKRWRIINYVNSGDIRFEALNDANNTVTATPIILTDVADVHTRDIHIRDAYEKSRAFPMGHWVTVPYNAANFYALAPMTWTVTATAAIWNRYTIIGKTIFWSLYISWYHAAGSNVVGGSPSTVLRVAFPAGITSPGTQAQTIAYQAGAGTPYGAGLIAQIGANNVDINRSDLANFPVGSAIGFVATLIFEIN